MRDSSRFLWLGVGLILGLVGAGLYILPGQRAAAGTSDRFEDYIICTGTVSTRANAPTDGVWLLDYRTGRLLATVIDRSAGKIWSWAELDLVKEFEIPPGQNPHFVMTTGQISLGQAALYVAEVKSGKLGVYSMGPNVQGPALGMSIYRHDLGSFRRQNPADAPAKPGGDPNAGARPNLVPFAGPPAQNGKG